MPKRRSLVGTAREAIGETPAAQPRAPSRKQPAKEDPHKQRRAEPRAAPAAAVSEATATERDRSAPPSLPNAYEAMMGVASATLRQNLETGARLARCKTPMEVLAAQTAHAAALTQSFIAASFKLMHAGLPGTPWAPLKPRNEPQ